MAEEWGCKLRDEGQRGWRRACRWSPWPLRKSSSRGHSVIFRGGLLLPSSWFPPELSPCLRTRGYRLFSGFEKWVSGLALFFQTLRSEPGRDDLDLDIKSSMVGWGGVCDGFPCGPCPPVASGVILALQGVQIYFCVLCEMKNPILDSETLRPPHSQPELGPVLCSPLWVLAPL